MSVSSLMNCGMVLLMCILYSSAKLHTLLHAMSPAILRIGGSPADWLFFDKPLSVLQAAGLRPKVTVATSTYQFAFLAYSDWLFF